MTTSIEKKQLIKQMYEKGMSQTEIARFFGVHHNTVYRICKDESITIPDGMASGITADALSPLVRTCIETNEPLKDDLSRMIALQIYGILMGQAKHPDETREGSS